MMHFAVGPLHQLGTHRMSIYRDGHVTPRLRKTFSSEPKVNAEGMTLVAWKPRLCEDALIYFVFRVYPAGPYESIRF